MKIVECNRVTFYDIAKIAFGAIKKVPMAAEIGVFKGDNAEQILNRLQPSELHLIDAWSESEFYKSYTPFEPRPYWIDDPKEHFGYYGGDAMTRDHWDSVYQNVVARFKQNKAVKIHRKESGEAINYLSESKLQFDFIYIDASHQYEFVFRDLMYYKDYVSDDGIIQLNDCCHSDLGIKQNLGVLEAVIRFIKITNFVPVLMNSEDFTDLVLVRRRGILESLIDELMFNSTIKYIELPYQLLGAAQVKRNRMNKLIMSFV